ncbi:MAG: hypothetical protein FD163_56 [Hyphomonadaceae bacterium]|nr:MAG: hypothetical protein FD128_1167 [Hyphomonadaceae bacterium]KAF0186781.1 MAG: hypothetical protein FD163_56 [Hyphomonadaceae bacterium]
MSLTAAFPPLFRLLSFTMGRHFTLLELGLLLPLALIGTGVTAQSRNNNGQDAAEFRTLFSAREVETAPQISRVQVENGGGFTIDRTQSGAVLVQFDGSSEVWALQSSSGPRGDEFLRNDVGQVMLRITALGGITLYSTDESTGRAASVSGRGEAIISLYNKYNGSLQAAVERSVARFNPRLLPNLRIESVGGVPAALAYETLERAHDAVEDIPPSNFPQNRRFRIIRVSRAPQAFVILQNQILEIGVTPGIGYAGRPSSSAIKAAILN